MSASKNNQTASQSNLPHNGSPLRYARQTQLRDFGQAAQQKLHEARVLVVGAGGLGVPVLQYLTAMGIGTIGIIDMDTISLSNLHRQVLYNEDETGHSKVNVALNKLSRLNSGIGFKVYDMALTPQNALTIVDDYDVVVDATDNFDTRYLLNDACVILNKPYVYGAVQQYEGQVSVFNYQDGPTYRCLYPTQPSPGQIPDCNSAGVLGVVPGIIGCQQALQVVKLITGVGKTLSGYLQVFDFLNDEQYKIKLKARPENKGISMLQQSYIAVACNAVLLLSVEELYDWYEKGRPFDLLDVRETDEFDDGHLKNAVSVPFTTFKPAAIIAEQGRPIVTFCQKGARSNKAAQLLQQQYPQAAIYSVLGGMEYWQDEFDNEYLIRDTLP